MVVPVKVLVDQVLVLDLVRSLGELRPTGLSQMVPQGREGEHQGRQPLLPVDHEPPLHTRGSQLTRGQHHRSEEVRDRGLAFELRLHEVADVIPQPSDLRLRPAVGALVQGHLELLFPLDQLDERDLLGVHLLPLRVVSRGASTPARA